AAEDRGPADAGNRAVALFDALDDDLLVSAQLVDDDAEMRAFAGVGDDDDAVVGGGCGRSDVEQVAETDQRHQIAAQLQHARGADQIVDLGGRRPQALDDRRHRHHVGFETDPDHHAVHHRQRQRQGELDGHAAAAFGFQRDATADVLDVAAHDVHADAAAGNVGDLLGGGKAGQEDQVVDLLFAQHRVGADQAALARFLQHALGIDAGAVVLDLDDDAAAAMLGGEPDGALFGLAGGGALGGRLDAVVDRIAD